MLELEENLKFLLILKKRIQEIKNSLNIEKLIEKRKELEEESLKENFWSNKEHSSSVFAQIKALDKKIVCFNDLNSSIDNLIDLNRLLQNDFDKDLFNELIKTSSNIEISLNKLEVETIFKGKYDYNNAIITLHPGAGGTESQDWVEMLYRMYGKWASSNGYTLKELDYLAGDEAGIKSVTALISGEYAYGYLKGEMGVHRLVRISPFDSGGRRHTSFASLEVLPEITDDIEIDINPDDLRIDTYRASGAGGQHINKTDSAVRITHIPTNIVVSCQSERSQIMNKETAMRMLKSKLLDLKEKENKETIDELKGEQKEIAWGSQIRSYVFCPYTLVKDHRTNYEVGNIEAVMNGDINNFMIEYLKKEIKN